MHYMHEQIAHIFIVHCANIILCMRIQNAELCIKIDFLLFMTANIFNNKIKFLNILHLNAE